MNDTICAISTSQGIGAISIVRVSGEEAIEIVNKIFKGKKLNKVKSHTINYGHIVDDEKIIDEVLVSVMRAPKTFTTSFSVEPSLIPPYTSKFFALSSRFARNMHPF